MEGWKWYYENSQPGHLRRKTKTARFMERKKKMGSSGMERKSVAIRNGPGRLSTNRRNSRRFVASKSGILCWSVQCRNVPTSPRGGCVVGMLNRQIRKGKRCGTARLGIRACGRGPTVYRNRTLRASNMASLMPKCAAIRG
jgi:hypothetical protein